MLIQKKPSKSNILLFYRVISVALVFLFAILCIAASVSSVNTFIVYNGDEITVFNSNHKDTATAMTESGIVIDEAHYVEMQQQAEHGLAEIHIFPKKKVTVKRNGEVKTLYTEKSFTVSEFLNANNILFDDDDILSLPLGTVISEDCEIQITDVLHKTEEVTVSLPFSTEKKPSSNLEKGTTKVIQQGKNGSKKIVYDIELRDGEEFGRKIVSETTVNEPVTKIVEYGTKKVDKTGVIATSKGEKLKYKKKINMTATAYTTERTSDKITATGKVARVGLVAVDPRVIPLGSRLYIESYDGKSWCYGTAVAADTGVRGNKIDLFFNTYRECINFGRRKATVYVLE